VRFIVEIRIGCREITRERTGRTGKSLMGYKQLRQSLSRTEIDRKNKLDISDDEIEKNELI